MQVTSILNPGGDRILSKSTDVTHRVNCKKRRSNARVERFSQTNLFLTSTTLLVTGLKPSNGFRLTTD